MSWESLYGTVQAHSLTCSLALVMEGMDVGLVNNFFGQPAYKQRFGSLGADGKMSIPANWQAAINNGQQAGQVIGLLFNGWAQSRYGSRRIYMGAMVAMFATSESDVPGHGLQR